MEEAPRRSSKAWDSHRGRWVFATPQEVSDIAQISRPASLDTALNHEENANGANGEVRQTPEVPMAQDVGAPALSTEVVITPVA